MVNYTMGSVRKEDRKKIVRPVYFHGEGGTGRFAFSVNYSSSGLCIITNRPIAAGDTVRLLSSFFWQGPREAVAVWSKEDRHDIAWVGMSLSPLN